VVAATFLVIISEREALAWVLEHQRMAVPSGRRHLVEGISPGDELLLYTTRGCFHNPTRDRGRIIGRARALTAVELLHEPVELVGRSFPLGFHLELLALSPLGSGLELSPLVERLSVFPVKHAWSGRLRRPMLELPAPDAILLRRRLRPLTQAPRDVLSAYLDAGRPIAAA
jgi:hypothetical protein